MPGLDCDAQIGVNYRCDVVGESFEIAFRSDIKCDEESVAFPATHAAELNTLVFEKQLFVLKQVFLAFFFRKRCKVLCISARVDEFSLRFKTLRLFNSWLIVQTALFSAFLSMPCSEKLVLVL